MPVVLALATRADTAELIQGNLDNREYHHPWMAPFTDEAGFDAWFGRTLSGPNVGLIARKAASGRLVGVVNLNEIVAGVFQSAYLSYYGMAALAGCGLMTEAVRLATAHTFGVLGLHRLEANIQPGNHRSLALVKQLGFRLEGFSPRYLRIGGEWRDHERWALLADHSTAAAVRISGAGEEGAARGIAGPHSDVSFRQTVGPCCGNRTGASPRVECQCQISSP